MLYKIFKNLIIKNLCVKGTFIQCSDGSTEAEIMRDQPMDGRTDGHESS